MAAIPVQDIQIDLPFQAIANLCRRYGVQELSVFGSALRPDFTPESDLDFLVRFLNDDAGPWMGKLPELEAELSTLLRRRVDLVSKGAIERSENYIRRRHILSSARVIYVA